MQSLHDIDKDHNILLLQHGPDLVYFQLNQADLHPQVVKITLSYTHSKGIICYSIPDLILSEVYSLHQTSPSVQQTFDPR
eukprot:12464389-Ditylum_brightwellii.AAC.1